jgi:hypothetical protein
MPACCSELAPKSPVNGFLQTILAAIALEDDSADLQRARPPKHDLFPIFSMRRATRELAESPHVSLSMIEILTIEQGRARLEAQIVRAVAKVQREEGYDADKSAPQNPSTRTRKLAQAFTAKVEGPNPCRPV